jgi:hypothetical protein
MSQSQVQTLVNLLSNNQADANLFADFYNDIMETLGPAHWHTNTALIATTPENSLLTLPASLLDLIQLIYDNTTLSELNLREVEEIATGWRNMKGRPVAYTRQSENVKTVELLPPPDESVNVTSIHAETRSAELSYLTLPFALKILAREYVRESDHFDRAFAKICDEFADLLLGLMRDNYERGRIPP